MSYRASGDGYQFCTYYRLFSLALRCFDGETYIQVLSYAAIPFPLYKAPASETAVEINFWFFLFVYYGLYNAVGLLWITKLFNLFSVNWWPRNLGGFWSFCLFWSVSILVGSMAYVIKEDWGTWTLSDILGRLQLTANI